MMWRLHSEGSFGQQQEPAWQSFLGALALACGEQRVALHTRLLHRRERRSAVLTRGGGLSVATTQKREDIHKAFEQIYSVLLQFRKQAGAQPPAGTGGGRLCQRGERRGG